MRHPRRLVLAVPLALALAGCAGMQRPADSPAARFAAALEGSDPLVDAAVAKMDAFERRSMREEQAIAFALGGRPVPAPPAPPAGAAEAAGEVLGPAFTALGDYAHLLAQAAAGDPGEGRPESPEPEVLAQMVAQALPGVRASLAPAIREAGLAGVAALARLPDAYAGRRVAPEALAREAQPSLAAVAALLRGVVGAETGQATRGAIAARRQALDAAQLRFLEALRGDRGISPATRYTLFHQIAGLRDEDPLPGTLGAVAALLAAMEQAHAALAAGGGGAEAPVAAFEAAVARLSALAGVAGDTED